MRGMGDESTQTKKATPAGVDRISKAKQPDQYRSGGKEPGAGSGDCGDAKGDG